MSRNSHDILLQWLSGAGLDEEWEMGRQTSAGRQKAAVHGIVVNRIRIAGEPYPARAITDFSLQFPHAPR
jgi:transcription initiation factor TFIID subunit 5